MRSSAWFALALAAPFALAPRLAHADPPPDQALGYADPAANGPPVGWRDPSVGKETRSTSMVVVGTILISVAATMLPIGTVMWSGAGQDCVSDATGQSFTCVPARERLSGIGVLCAAAGGLAVGLPLVVLGAQKVPIEIPRRASLIVGPTGASFRYDF